MFAAPSGINHRPATVPGIPLAHPQEQGQEHNNHNHHHLQLLHASSSSAASHIARPKRKISSKPIRASAARTPSRSNLPSQESAFLRNPSYATDTAAAGDSGAGQPINLMMNHSRQRVPSSMSTLSAFGSHNTRSSRALERTQQDKPIPFRGEDRSLQQESSTENKPHYLYNQNLGIHQQESSRDHLQLQNLSRQQEHHRPQQQPPRSDPLTIRDILDRKDLRDQISEMRRSINSNPDDPRKGLMPGQEFDPRLSPEVMAQHERLRKASEASRAGSAFWNPSQRVGPSIYNTRRPAQEDSVVADLSMDHSLLEQQFREKLEAAIQTTGPTNREQKVRTQPKNQYTPAAAAETSLGPTIHTSINPGQNMALHRSPSSERRARDLYHSSYSPSEFSQTEDLDNDYSLGDGSKDGKDFNNTSDSRGSGTPTPTGVSAFMTTPKPIPPAGMPLALPHSRPNPPSSLGPPPKSNELSRPTTVRPKNNHDQEDHAADDSGEISFEREVARARAKRELGQSRGQSLNQEQRQESEAGKGGPSTRSIRKLDHGRGLALEDLASPTHYGFEEETGTEQRGGGRANDGVTGNHFPLLAAATDLARMNIVTEPEDRFMELAGSLGEGQAVASVLGTLKGMIRQLKTEKKTSQSAIKKLQKDLKQSQKELERTRKAKEKLAKPKSTHTTTSLNEGSRRSHRSIKHDKNSKTIEQQHVILMEQEENEARAAVIGKEKDLVERNLAKLQKRINALELQRDEVRKRDLRRAEEEADLLFLIKSDSEDDSEDDNEDDDDESSSSDSASESEYRSEPERGEDDQQEDLGATVRYIGRSGGGGSAVNRPRGAVAERNGQSFPTEKSTSLAKKIPRDNVMNGTLPKRSVKPLEGALEPSQASKKSSMSRSSRSKSGLVEEVHVHHHVHFEDEEILEILGIHSKANSPTGRAARSSQKPGASVRLGRVGEELEEQHPLGHPADVHRVHLGTGFRSSRRGSHTEGSDGVQSTRSLASSSRDKHAPAVDKLHPRLDYKPRSPLAADRTTAVEDYPQRQSLTTARSLLSSVRGNETRLDDNDEESPSLALTNGPQKKIAINLPRILSLLKNHDPRRCTVCCDGGTNGQKCTRHRYHEHKVVMATSTSTAMSTSPSALPSPPSSQMDRQHQSLHVGKLPRQKSTVTSGTIKVGKMTTESLSDDSLESGSSESEESGAGVGPARSIVVRDTPVSISASPQTSTGEAYMSRSSGGGVRITKAPPSDPLLKPQEKLQLEVNQIAAEIQFFREYLKRSTLATSPSANGNTSSSSSKAAAASVI